jgi:putative sigma-54 modulation protein
LYKGPASNPENDYCEIRLEIPGNDHFVKKHSPHFETSVSECVDVLKLQANKTKEKHTDNRQADATEIQDALIKNDSSQDDTE